MAAPSWCSITQSGMIVLLYVAAPSWCRITQSRMIVPLIKGGIDSLSFRA
ncbi:MAG TPA: hypothetical protein PLC04_09220 [Candidatus Kapabacteria bacterium]|nr:hypothetical protein [Candidatus Kapabacteria bacterium]HOV93238.1 hypothetical protein [Candidatus Kapabacteria bacterium]